MLARYWQHGQPSKHCHLKAISAQKIWQPATAPRLLYWSKAPSKPNYILYFEIVIGSIALDKTTDELVKVFGNDEERSIARIRSASVNIIHLLRVQEIVRTPFEDNVVAVSSFAWALTLALDLKLKTLKYCR